MGGTGDDHPLGDVFKSIFNGRWWPWPRFHHPKMVFLDIKFSCIIHGLTWNGFMKPIGRLIFTTTQQHTKTEESQAFIHLTKLSKKKELFSLNLPYLRFELGSWHKFLLSRLKGNLVKIKNCPRNCKVYMLHLQCHCCFQWEGHEVNQVRRPAYFKHKISSFGWKQGKVKVIFLYLPWARLTN